MWLYEALDPLRLELGRYWLRDMGAGNWFL